MSGANPNLTISKACAIIIALWVPAHAVAGGAPALFGNAVQGGFLYGESRWDVSGPNLTKRDGVFVIALPMDAPEILTLEFCKNEKCGRHDYKIEQRKYKEQNIRVDSKFTEYPPDVQKRIDAEAELIRKTMRILDFERLNLADWEYPFAKKYKSGGGYGARRVFNGMPKSPHKGWDIAAPRGAEVRPMARGRVALAIDGYLTGRTVLVSHGYGIYSAYMHLDRILVSQGDEISPASAIGTVGSSGRVSGPHLHLGLYADGVALDAELLFRMK
ncbi:MAG: M23 family metallopeptidase [Rickettsiales bacterium]|jgi:hypothetical protein|nr:M23 family metallopeptidase [Rickettsiales bacterium]